MDEPESQRSGGSGIPVFFGRALICLVSMTFLGFGLGLSVHKGASFVWTAGSLVTLALVLLLMARWQVWPLAEPLSQLLGGTRPRSIEDLPGAWSALERENDDLKERAAREDRLLPGIMARLEEGVLLFGPSGRGRGVPGSGRAGWDPEGLPGGILRVASGAGRPDSEGPRPAVRAPRFGERSAPHPG